MERFSLKMLLDEWLYVLNRACWKENGMIDLDILRIYEYDVQEMKRQGYLVCDHERYIRQYKKAVGIE